MSSLAPVLWSGRSVCALSRDPFTDIGGTVFEFDSVGLTDRQEFHSFAVDEKDIFEIEREAARLMLQHVLEYFNMFSSNPAAYEQH